MNTRDFFFDLPPELIAQRPPPERGQDRLMVLDRAAGTRRHCRMEDLPGLLERGWVLVFNDSRVRKARLLARSRDTGAQVEFLLLEPATEPKRSGGVGSENRVSSLEETPLVKDDPPGLCWKALVSRSKRRREGSSYVFEGGLEGEILPRHPGETADSPRRIRFDRPLREEWLEAHGRIPLPPYIRRGDDPADSERYQTVYARAIGSAAAPTAGLHFTQALLEELAAAGVELAFVTLHVGLGTFLPVRTDQVEDHRMHEEWYSIGEETANRIERARAEGRKVIAVGTTALRTLESAWREGPEEGLTRGEGRTSIFIYPGYRFQVVDGLFTNFHTPLSTLLMLTAAFAGRDFLLESYREAVQEGYRFFSYGDAMLIV